MAVYVRTQIQNPVLSLTASVTLRDAPARKKAVNAETGSIFSNAESTRTDGTEDIEVEDDEEEDVAVMEEIDLLGGLGTSSPQIGSSVMRNHPLSLRNALTRLTAGDERVPTSRLAQSLREDLSLPPVLPSGSVPPSAASLSSFHQPTPSTASMPSTAGVARERHAAPIPSSPLNTTLRKSYRRILTLSSGLRVRMRTLFLPQLLPPRSGLEQQDDEDEGERRVALCVEVENPLDSPAMAFEVESITVDVGGKGGKAQASLICQPEQQSADTSVFPLLLDPVGAVQSPLRRVDRQHVRGPIDLAFRRGGSGKDTGKGRRAASCDYQRDRTAKGGKRGVSRRDVQFEVELHARLGAFLCCCWRTAHAIIASREYETRPSGAECYCRRQTLLAG